MTSKRVMYSDFYKNETRFIVDCLKEKNNWEPILFHTTEDSREYFNEKYPNALFCDMEKLRKGYFDYSHFSEVYPIDANIIHKLSKFELNYLNWLEDSNGFNFSFYQRRTYYYDILKYWNTVINTYKPDLFVVNNWPHLASDYALYLIAKHIHDIPVIFLDTVPRIDSDYFNFNYSLEDLSLPFKKLYLSSEELLVSEEVKEYLDKMRSSRVEKPKHITRYFKIYSKKKPLIRYMSYFRMLLATLLGRTWGYSNTAFKKNKKPWGNKNSQMRIWEHFLFRENLRLKNISIKKYYESMCSEVDFNKKFIYFAAPYQPEAFSNLITGLYEDVFIILDNLSKVIPKNWVIYYKEHPGTFNEIDKGALGRNKEFYDRLKTYSQVIPLKSSENHYLLIDKSIAAATTGGSVGWEAIVRGKPSILFGAMWYSSCHGVFNVYSYQDLEKAIESIKKGFSPDDKQVDRYAETMRQCSYKGLITPMFFRELIPKAENPKREMEKIASAYIESYEKFYGK